MTTAIEILRDHRSDLDRIKYFFDRLTCAERFDRGRQENELADALAEAIAKSDRALDAVRGA